MSFHRRTLHELATHEAGHAYVFASVVRHGVPEELGVGHDAAGEKHGWCRRTRLLHAGNTFANLQEDVQPYVRWQAAAEIVIAIAGPVAEFRHRHRSRAAGAIVIHHNAEVFLRPDTFDTADDFERIRSVLDYVGAPDPVASLRKLAGVSDDIVAANWPNIRRLAQLLLESRTLDADELHRWFERDPAVPYQDEILI